MDSHYSLANKDVHTVNAMKDLALIFLVAGSFSNYQSLCSQQHYSFALLERPPGVFLKNYLTSTNQSQYDGTAFLVINWLEKKLDITISAKVLPNNTTVIGQPISGQNSWDGAIGDVLRKKYDGLGPALVATYARGQVLDWIGLYFSEDSALATPPLTEESGVFAILDPFSPMVWIMILVSLICIAVGMTVVYTITYQFERSSPRFTTDDFVLQLLAIALNQGETFYLTQRWIRTSLKLTIAPWCLLALVLVNLYSSVLVSHLTTRKKIQPPQTSFEIVEQGFWSYLVPDNGIGRELILGATSGPIKKLGDFFRQHPENFVATNEDAFVKVTSGCCAFSELVSYLEYRTNLDFEQTGKCRVYIGGRQSGFRAGFAIPKGNPARERLNLSLLKLYETGIYSYWMNSFSVQSVCAMQWKEVERVSIKRRTLNLRDFKSTFFIFGIGLGLGLFAFGLEHMQIMCHTKKKFTESNK